MYSSRTCASTPPPTPPTVISSLDCMYQILAWCIYICMIMDLIIFIYKPHYQSTNYLEYVQLVNKRSHSISSTNCLECVRFVNKRSRSISSISTLSSSRYKLQGSQRMGLLPIGFDLRRLFCEVTSPLLP
jgi:hypothetical protein